MIDPTLTRVLVTGKVVDEYDVRTTVRAALAGVVTMLDLAQKGRRKGRFLPGRTPVVCNALSAGAETILSFRSANG